MDMGEQQDTTVATDPQPDPMEGLDEHVEQDQASPPSGMLLAQQYYAALWASQWKPREEQSESSIQGQQIDGTSTNALPAAGPSENFDMSEFIYDESGEFQEDRGHPQSPTSTISIGGAAAPVINDEFMDIVDQDQIMDDQRQDLTENQPQQYGSPSPYQPQSPMPNMFGPSQPYFRWVSPSSSVIDMNRVFSPTRIPNPHSHSIDTQLDATDVLTNAGTKDLVSTYVPLDPQLAAGQTQPEGTFRPGPWMPNPNDPRTVFRVLTRINPATSTLEAATQSSEATQTIVATGDRPAGPPPPVAMWSTAAPSQSNTSRVEEEPTPTKGKKGKKGKKGTTAKKGKKGKANSKDEEQETPTKSATKKGSTQLQELNPPSNTETIGPAPSPFSVMPTLEQVQKAMRLRFTALAQHHGSMIPIHTGNFASFPDTSLSVDPNLGQANNIDSEEDRDSLLRAVRNSASVLPPPHKRVRFAADVRSGDDDADDEDDVEEIPRGVTMSDFEASDNIRGDIGGWKIVDQQPFSSLAGFGSTFQPAITYLRDRTATFTPAYADQAMMDIIDDQPIPSSSALVASYPSLSSPPHNMYFGLHAPAERPTFEPTAIDDNVDNDRQGETSARRRAPEENMMSEERAALEYEFWNLEKEDKKKNEDDGGEEELEMEMGMGGTEGEEEMGM